MIALNENEAEALRILWERGESKPADVQAHFSWPIDNGTLRSTLVNLVRKKHVEREQRGKAFYYIARVPKATLLKTIIRDIADIFAKGSTRDLVAHLVETEELTKQDLKLLETAAKAGPKEERRLR